MLAILIAGHTSCKAAGRNSCAQSVAIRVQTTHLDIDCFNEGKQALDVNNSGLQQNAAQALRPTPWSCVLQIRTTDLHPQWLVLMHRVPGPGVMTETILISESTYDH